MPPRALPRRSLLTIVSAAVVCLVVRGAGAQSSAITVFASNGVKAVVEALQKDAERATGHTLNIQFDTSTALERRIDTAEPFDVAIVTTESMDGLIKKGRIVATTRAPIARSGIGVGIRKGAAKPDIGTAAAMKRTLLGARKITYAQDGASRVHILRMLDRLGIADEMAAKTILEQGSIRSTGRVANGDADLVLTLVSEILPIGGIELVGPLPAEFQSYVSLAAGVGTKSKNAEVARSLIMFLSGPATASTLKAKGMEKP
jgi:molybdate transport system substrate-binding protein